MTEGYEWVLEIDIKGGPGSGHHGHAGRPGQRGGSAPGKGGGGSAARTVARGILEQARKVEPAVTRTVVGTVAANGGEMYQLDQRLKGEDSLTDKIRRVSRESGLSPEEVGRTQIRDAVRYTAVFDSENYTQGAIAVQQALADQGWVQYDHQFKNYWNLGDDYDGYNCVFVNDKGLKMELQFHTRQSAKTKAKSHILYKKAQALPPGPEYSQLVQQMSDLWGQVDRPKGWQNLPGRQM